ncbi:MSMEG_0565 family glycosyltransferase [Amycolatopsis acidicola]|uniref:MSMEG_0565 family glycosyltransferase n=1 Tax=Amycolatopsis acidicola TaxID=2596893 RepID=A0A5N0V5B0_9PSEU|nr:MSMEG_0565 family glycosyltransferase [Amycolatopsis acidicola]KAA9160558.1 MSMEG_0565 family glycosyltransferase [Amycolatopsis acidicola]
MRIALLSYSTKPRGGVVHTLALAEALAAAGEDVTVWTLGRGGDSGFFRPVDSRVRQRIVPFPDREGEGVGPRILRSIDALRAAFDPADYHIVHAQDCISANAVERCVRTVHHLDQFTTPELAACHERAIVRPFAHVCVSAAVAEELRQGWGIKATVIPNGVDARRFAQAAEDGPARRRWQAELGHYVLAVGGIEPRKGTLDLLEAYAILRESDPGVRLVIAGGETLFDYRDYRARFDKRAAELGVEPMMLGPVGHDELPSLVAAAGVFAFPSTKEGFGLAAMEALAAGVPVVTRELPVLREVFGGAARFAEDPAGFATQFRAALDDPDSLRVAGQTLAAGYSWEKAASDHVRLYRDLLS